MRQKLLSDLEQEVMNIVWELGTCSVRDVLSQVTKNRQLAYTTIATILERLLDKGLLIKQTSGFTVMFTAKQSKSEFSRKMAQSLLDKYFGTFGDAAIASFAKSIEELPKHKKEKLLKLLLNHDKNK